ncbi:peptidase C39 [Xaviernesmea oryzae]|uniref:Peptidase C39 n=1 Tax=Xaviernesmea oryzae TaxID=464029 RepID=A0A1Q9B3H5_9HYPH|nr:type I secretion system permease/ATPase [Xaviernesmea oryzae]OLP62583.1 peptidase C39 [Xaviernesmea oryzae]
MPAESRDQDPLLWSLCGVAAYWRIAADPALIRRELALGSRALDQIDLLRAAKSLGMKAKIVPLEKARRLLTLPLPAILPLRDGGAVVLTGALPSGLWRVVDPIRHVETEWDAETLLAQAEPRVVLLARRLGGPGQDPRSFGFSWFWPSIWRYRRPLAHVLVASLLVQIFALISPLFFQVVIDKVLLHQSYSTLFVLVGGLAAVGLFDMVMQYLRSYALNHTTNRIDVELGRRLFRHLLSLPIGYFESRPTGQTVARMRELETIRAFLTGQGLFAALDFVFAFVFLAVLFAYSWKLSIIVLVTVPLYMLIAALSGPGFRARLDEKFRTGAASQQFLVETVVGAETIKASAVEPIIAREWEERLAAYVRASFRTTMFASKAQQAVQYLNKLSSAALLLFGAKAVIDGELSVGALVAFNMIAGQVAQPVLRLSQLWQDFQQIMVSVARVGDILDTPPEPAPPMQQLPPPSGLVEFKHVSFRYQPSAPPVLKSLSFTIRPGQVIGIVGPSGSGKSTLTKLIQRMYLADEGQVLIDGADVRHVNPVWLRSHIGVVLQENLLLNRTIHENIALGVPAMPRAGVIAAARLAGADEFIARLPQGYDTMIEERGSNLSGGQRQRIAIARALAGNPPILIFDEATSALDYESERIIQNNMRDIVKNRTVFVIAHRLAAVRHCDAIIGMIDGRMVEAGTHDQLLARPNGLYARLWSLQSERTVA